MRKFHYIFFGFLFVFISIRCKESSSTDLQGKSDSILESKLPLSSFATPDKLYPDLFVDVQMSNLFPDSKTFVDCTAKKSAEDINNAYASEKSKSDFDLTSFVNTYFDVPALVSSDFKSDLSRTAEEHVEALWPVLKRESDKSNTGSTLIALPHPYIVPGGRFREVYYWDSYFTMLGLVESGEYELIENMLDNFAHLIKTVGHIPNGNRVYYKTRSQPPFFAQMVKLYAEEKGNQVYSRYADALQGEYDFWMDGADQVSKGEAIKHVVHTDYGMLNRYFDLGTTPRQESYSEDYDLVNQANGGDKMYRDLRSGAESGWDYSSRWFADGQHMHTIETTDIIPVDLNALLYGLEEILHDNVITDVAQRDALKSSMENRKKFIQEICFASDWSIQDYNWKTKKVTGIRSLAMVYPLFFKMISDEDAQKVAKYVESYFLRDGGVVTTLHTTGQQWDAPNGWAPLQWMTIIGLDNYGHKELAVEIAQRWTKLNEKVYKNTGKFVEKYNVEDMTLTAGGGEYPVQDGFGWSNGVYLALKTYIKERKE